MHRNTFKTDYSQTIDWYDGCIIDWSSAGQLYGLDGTKSQKAKYHYAYSFDGSITSSDGQYSFIYKRLGTKGLLLKNGEILREINRPYYHADTYEYPAAFFKFGNITFLAHCPIAYNQLDFENVETGEIVTNVRGRNPADVFHSRLLVSTDNKYLMVRGWVWHPYDTVELFNVPECIKNPMLLDKYALSPDFGTEINAAGFIDDESILLGSSNEEPFDDEEIPQLPPSHVAIWNFKENLISSPVKVDEQFGNLFALNDRYAWDMYLYPKIIDLKTGKVVSKMEDIYSGTQSSSILNGDMKTTPQICFDRHSLKIAIRIDSSTIEVLSPGKYGG